MLDRACGKQQPLLWSESNKQHSVLHLSAMEVKTAQASKSPAQEREIRPLHAPPLPVPLLPASEGQGGCALQACKAAKAAER